jgi:hypothetical protein
VAEETLDLPHSEDFVELIVTSLNPHTKKPSLSFDKISLRFTNLRPGLAPGLSGGSRREFWPEKRFV